MLFMFCVYVLIHILTKVGLAHCEIGLSPQVQYFYRPFQGGASFVDHLYYFCLVFAMLSCASVYKCLVVTCCEMVDLL